MRSSFRRRWLLLAGVAVVGLGIAGWGLAGWPGMTDKKADAPIAATRPVAPAPRAPDGKVKVSGSVIDRVSGKPVGRVMVVLLGDNHEVGALADTAGAFELTVAPGRYHAFVRDDAVLTVGMQGRVRLDEAPRADLAGIADAEIMPVLDAFADATDVELYVERAAILSGFVFDREKRTAIAGAIVRVHGPPTRIPFPRPALGTDITRSDENGKFSLRVPAGTYDVEATHEKYAGLEIGESTVVLEAGREEHVTLDLVRGCIITGRVVRSDGKPASDGALERDDADRPSGFSPVGRVNSDGTFRLATTDEENVVLRAWPWKAPPAADKTVSCRDGRRHANTVLTLPEADPDVSGVIVDASGARVPFAFVDVRPLDWTVGAQQERSDAGGDWAVYELLSGRYQLTATAPGLGVVDATIVSPRAALQLQLGGTGRIAGTTTDLVTGSFEVSFKQCGGGPDPIELAPEPRIVLVTAGHFTIDHAPACALTLIARWRDRVSEPHIVVEPNRTSYLEIAVGTPREKSVHGIVRDKDRKPVPNARVTAMLGDKESATVRSDVDGRYTIVTSAGAQLVGGNGRFSGRAFVGRANVPSEQVDLVLEDVESPY